MAESGSLKVGDVCKVVGNCNLHDFKIGEKIRLDSVFGYDISTGKSVGFRAKRLNGESGSKNVVREFDLEKVENMDKTKEFTKSDLKELDEVVYRNGDKSIFYQGDFRGIRTRYLEYYEENLLRKVLRNDGNNGADIMQVIRNKEVIWERIEKSPLQIKLEELEKQQRAIADEIAKLREEN